MRPLHPKISPPAYPKVQFYQLLSSLSIFPTCHVPTTHNWHYTLMIPPFSRSPDELTPFSRRLTHAMTMLYRYFTKWKLRVNINKTEAILITKRRPAFPIPLHFQRTAIPWSPHIRYHGLVLDSKLLFTKHLHSVIHKATGTFLKLFPLLACDSTLSLPNKLTLYKLLIRPVLTYAALVWSNTSSSNYSQLQILQSKCLRVIGNYPRSTPITHLHIALHLEPIHEFIYSLTNFCTAAQLTPTLLSVK